MSGAHEGVEQKVEEEFVIVDSDAVAHPGTVVVHLHHALVAHGAVMGTGWFNLLAFLTVAESDEASLRRGESFIDLELDLLPIFISWLSRRIVQGFPSLPLLH